MSASIYSIRRIIALEIQYVYYTFPSTILVWIDIFQRRVWTHQSTEINKVMERKRRRINGLGRQIVFQNSRGKLLKIDINFNTEKNL